MFDPYVGLLIACLLMALCAYAAIHRRWRLATLAYGALAIALIISSVLAIMSGVVIWNYAGLQPHLARFSFLIPTSEVGEERDSSILSDTQIDDFRMPQDFRDACLNSPVICKMATIFPPRWPKSPIVEKKARVDATFNKPDHLRLGTSHPVQLILVADPGKPANQQFVGVPGMITTKEIEVGRAVSAILTSDKEVLQITSRVDKVQTFSGENLSWVWDVKPLKPGKTLVTLEVMSHLKPKDGPEQVSMVRALQETWLIEAEGLEWAKYYWNEYDWLRTAVYGIVTGFVAVLGYFGFKGFGKKTEESGSA
jgi:hypothetical protein